MSMNTKLNIESIIDGSIEKSKLAESVQESLNKADNAMQSTDVETLLEDFVHKDDTINFANDLTGVVEATSEMFTYRPSAGDKSVRDESAVIRRIKGNSLVWNQTYPTDWTVTINNVKATSTNGIISCEGVLTTEKYKTFQFNTFTSNTANHVYLYICIALNDVAKNISKSFGLFNRGNNATSAFVNGVSTVLYLNNNASAGCYCGIECFENNVDCTGAEYILDSYDLTKMFGAGNEPTTVDEFYARIPEGIDIHAYNTGEVISMKATGIETIGFNQWDEEWELGGINVETGELTNSSTNIRSKNFIPVIGGKTYNFYCKRTDITLYFRVATYDVNKKHIGYIKSGVYPSTSITSANFNNPWTFDKDVAYIKFDVANTYGTVYKNDICINLSHSGVRNEEYKSYENNTLLLPEIANYFTDGMYGIGDVYDEINEKSAIKRFGVVDLGSLTWRQSTSSVLNYEYFIAPLENLKESDGYGGYANAICSEFIQSPSYPINDRELLDESFMIYYIKGNNTIYMRSSDTTLENFKNKVNGTLLYYELAEPIYTHIDEPLQLTYKVDDFGTEKMVSDLPSSPFKADIVYQFNAEGRIRDNSRNIERLENNIIDKQDTITDLDDIRDGAGKGKTSVQSITINGESKTPDENGVVDLGKTYVTTLAYTATSKVVENTEYPWSDDTFGAPIISHEYDETTGVGIIYFSGRITTIGFGAFNGCTSLTSVTIPDSVTTIGNIAFWNCDNLTSVTIGNSVTTIGDYAFYECDSLTNITIPNNVTSIGNGAFNRCTNLTSVTIPNSVTTIGDYAFYECTGLTSVTIPNSVTSIGNGAFYSCTNLTSVTIPNSVTSIGNGAFTYCSSLTSIYCKATIPPTGDDYIFYDKASGRKIYVPMESVDAYKSATGWSDHADNIVGYRFNANFNDYYTKSETDDIIDGAIEKSKLAESVQESLSNIEKLENNKQDKLISGTNIKTINEESILGEGDFVIDGNNIWVANDLAQETQYLNTTIKQYGELIESKYVKSETGIPAADLSEEVITSLRNANNAIRSTTGGGEIVVGDLTKKQFSIADVNGVPTLKIEMPTSSEVKSGRFTNRGGNSPFVGADIVWDLYNYSYELADSKYTKPEDGISHEDLHQDVLGELTLAATSVQPSDIEYEVVSFTIDDIDNCIMRGSEEFTIDTELNGGNFRKGKPLMIKKSANSEALYQLIYTKQGNTLAPNYGGTITCVVEGVTYEFYISYSNSNTRATILNIKRYYTQPYVLEFTVDDIVTMFENEEGTIEYNSFALYNALKDGRSVIIKHDNSTNSKAHNVIGSNDVALSTGSTKFTWYFINNQSVFKVLTTLSEQPVQEMHEITYEDVIEYILPKVNYGGVTNLVSNSTLKTINNKLIYKFSSTDDTNIYTYYPSVYMTRTNTTINPNYLYQFGRPGSPVSGNLDIKLGPEISSDVVNEYIFEIYITNRVPTLSLTPRNSTDTIKWVSGNAPVLEANKIYQISIINNLGTVLSWDNA